MNLIFSSGTSWEVKIRYKLERERERKIEINMNDINHNKE